MRISISPVQVTRLLLWGAEFFLVGHLIVSLLMIYSGDSAPLGVRKLVLLLDMNREGNLPMVFSVGLILIASALLAFAAMEARARAQGFVGHWRMMSIIFLALAFDEGGSLHEAASPVLRKALDMGGPLYYAWVAPAVVFLLVMAISYRRWLWALSSNTRRLFLLSAAVYVGGALGVEMLGGWYDDRHGASNLPYMMLTAVEEVLEMVGVILFIRALLLHLGRHGEPLVLDLCYNAEPGFHAEAETDQDQVVASEEDVDREGLRYRHLQRVRRHQRSSSAVSSGLCG